MQKETNGAKVPRHFTFKKKLAALGPGFFNLRFLYRARYRNKLYQSRCRLRL